MQQECRGGREAKPHARNWQRSAREPLGMVTDTAAKTQEKSQSDQYRSCGPSSASVEKKPSRPRMGFEAGEHSPCAKA